MYYVTDTMLGAGDAMLNGEEKEKHIGIASLTHLLWRFESREKAKINEMGKVQL